MQLLSEKMVILQKIRMNQGMEESINNENKPRSRRPRRPKKLEVKVQPKYIPDYHLTDFVAIDFEAANAAFTSACSMGVVIVRNGEIVERYYGLMKPEPNHYDWYNTKVHGLKKSDTENAPRFPFLWKQLEEKVKGLPFVAHGMLFERNVLRALHEFYHIPYPNYEFYCTHIGSQKYVPDLENHKLQTVAKHFGFDLAKHHNALADAEACAVIAMNIF